ncbi:hypothetical protein F5Y00DRAFT_102023 [Daldinia vernicosa]|uniref:uncharacterized protein n=1 Tax=Daldinia vernicosa TaxID=114800 RepID=UPI002008B3BA|nr:uncharacterized protein F5Y00DRAFT_102023 [Daldinia vernicosa]KAI0853473.1 hypothetical protein F5Y00DRAFT_102023 [Daldinia vernicosa]
MKENYVGSTSRLFLLLRGVAGSASSLIVARADAVARGFFVVFEEPAVWRPPIVIAFDDNAAGLWSPSIVRVCPLGTL